MYPVSVVRLVTLAMMVLFLVACGGDGKDGTEGPPALVATKPEAAGDNCPAGGWRIESGTDRNRDGVLSADEVQGVSYICHGEDGGDGQDGTDGQDGSDGQDGQFALTRITPIDAGEECLVGGHRIDSGMDQNGNGVLDSDEIQHTAYVCHGVDGEDGADGQDGAMALIRTEVEAPGDHCPAGGMRVLMGVDLNRNGLLDAGEVTQTAYLCHGEAGMDGSDGADGQDGTDGLQALLTSTQIPPGAQCAVGGYRLDAGLDLDGNGLLEEGEITSSFYVCHGTDGEDGADGQDGADGNDGADGQDGTDGLLSLVSITDEAPGPNCATGGKLIQTGIDLNSNGVLDPEEVQQSAYLCNGLPGADGEDGTGGEDGSDGQPGDDGWNALVRLNDEPAGENCAAGGVAINTGLDLNGNGELDEEEIVSTAYVCHGTGGPDAEVFRLEYQAQPGGTIIGQSVQNVLLGGSGEPVTASPDEGYFFTAWSDGSISPTRTDTGVQSDLSVQAGFSAYQYSLTYTAGSNGHVSGIVGQTIFHGADGSEVMAVPDPGYHFVEWSDGSTLNPRADLAVQGDVSVSANFALNQYTLTYQAGPGGSIMGNSPQQVGHGGHGSVVAAVPDAGYRFIRWSDDLTTTNRTDSNVEASLLVTAEFREQLAPPEGVQTSTVNGELIVSWEPIPDASGYNLYYAQESGVTPANYASLHGGGARLDVDSPVVLHGLDGGQRYYFIITTVINEEESAPGDELSQLLPHTPWLTRPHQGRLHVELQSSAEAKVSWDVEFGESYNLYISNDPDTDLSQYASYGAELRLNVVPPVSLENLVVGEPVYLALEANGDVTDWTSAVSLTWGVNGQVNAQVFGDDGTRYVGGNFTQAGMNVGHGVVFPQGTGVEQPHVLAMPEVNGTIHAVVSDEKGGWYIGGDFTQVGRKTRLRLAHIDSSGRVTDWNPGADDTIHALLLHNDVIYVGGDFFAAGGGAKIARNRIAAFKTDGSLISWNPQANDSVRSLLVYNERLYIGGRFTGIGGGAEQVSRARVASFFINDGGLTDWAPNIASGTVNSLSAVNNVVYAGGDISFSYTGYFDGMMQTYTRYRLAVIHASSGNIRHDFYPVLQNPWSSSSGQSVDAIITNDDSVFVGMNGGVRAYSASSASLGEVLWTVNVAKHVRALTIVDDVLYAGGEPDNVSEVPSSYLFALNVNNGNELDFTPNMAGPVFAMAGHAGAIYSGGDFVVAGAFPRYRLAAFDKDGVLSEWNPGTNGAVRSLAYKNNTVYAGGDFTLSGDGFAATARNRLAAFDEHGNLLSWNPGASSRVNSLVVMGSNIYAAGSFTSAGGGTGLLQPRSRLASFDLSGNLVDWNAEIQGIGQVANVLTATDGVIYVGGRFTSVSAVSGPMPRTNLAAFDVEGNIQSWAPQTDGAVTVFGLKDNTLYIAGSFSSASGPTGGSDRHGLAAFDLAGNLQPWNPGVSGGQVRSITALDDLIYVGGSFTAAGSGTGNTARQGLAAFTSDGLLTDWRPEVSDSVQSLVGSSGVLYVGGGFSSAHDGEYWIPRSRLAAFGSDGGVLDK